MPEKIITKDYNKRLRGDEANRIAMELCELMGIDKNKIDEIAIQAYIDPDGLTVLKARLVGASGHSLSLEAQGWQLIKTGDYNG